MKNTNLPSDSNFVNLFKFLKKCNVVSVRIVYSTFFRVESYYEVVCRTDSSYLTFYLKPLPNGGVTIQQIFHE